MSERMRLPRFAGLLLVLAACSPAANSQQARTRPSLQVNFRVQAIRYRGHFSADLPKLEQLAATRFAKTLGERFAFLNFTTDAQPIRLTITLANSSTSASCAPDDAVCPKETVFSLLLEQPGAPSVSYNRWTYLKSQDFFAVLGGVSEEVENFDRVGFANLNQPEITARFFSRIQLSPNARLIWKTINGSQASQTVLAGMTVPLPANLLCADQHSVLVMQSEIPQEFTAGAQAELAVDAQGPFLPPENSPDESWKQETGNLFGVPADDPPHDRKWDAWGSLSSVSDRNRIKIKGVYMYQYRHMDTGCSAAIPPAALATGAGVQP